MVGRGSDIFGCAGCLSVDVWVCVPEFGDSGFELGDVGMGLTGLFCGDPVGCGVGVGAGAGCADLVHLCSFDRVVEARSVLGVDCVVITLVGRLRSADVELGDFDDHCPHVLPQ